MNLFYEFSYFSSLTTHNSWSCVVAGVPVWGGGGGGGGANLPENFSGCKIFCSLRNFTSSKNP